MPYSLRSVAICIKVAFECVRKQENGMKTNFLLFLAALFLTVSVLGCNMMRGAGKDMENAGESIQRTVDHND